TCRKIPRENGLAAGRLMARRDLRISRMAEHALVRSQAPGKGMQGIVTRAHTPITAFLGVPAEWKLSQTSARRAVQIRSRVAARAQHVVDLHLFDVRLFPAETDLPAALIVTAATLD